MNNFIKTLLSIVLILLLQVLIYFILIEPIIIHDGATKEEISMPMVGDNKKSKITSTRAIQIDAAKDIVWKLLMQLGANRQGFYSYDFIEHELGNKAQYSSLNRFNIIDLKVGDIIHGSIDKESLLSTYNFPVLYVKRKESLVLGNWGTFLLRSTAEGQTRLIVRTQEVKSTKVWTSFKNHLIIPFHYIMERRMLLGIKMHAEAREKIQFSHNNDFLWFTSIIFSWCLILVLFFVFRGVIRRVGVTSFLGSLWLGVVFLFEPIALYSVAFLVIMSFILFIVFQVRKNKII